MPSVRFSRPSLFNPQVLFKGGQVIVSDDNCCCPCCEAFEPLPDVLTVSALGFAGFQTFPITRVPGTNRWESTPTDKLGCFAPVGAPPPPYIMTYVLECNGGAWVSSTIDADPSGFCTWTDSLNPMRLESCVPFWLARRSQVAHCCSYNIEITE